MEPRKPQPDAQALFTFGMDAIANGELAVAIDRMRAALRLHPRYQPAIEWLAVLNVQTQDFDQAEKYAHRALLANPFHFESLLALGQCQAARGEFESALTTYDKAEFCGPVDFRLHLAKGRALRSAFRLTEALTELQSAAELSQNSELFVEVGELLTAMGRSEDALSAFSGALSTQPESLPATILMAKALTDLDRVVEANPYWIRAEELEQSVGQARLAKALSFALSGRFKDAETEALNSIELNPLRGKPYLVLFGARRARLDDKPMIARIEELMKRADVSEADQVDLLYALGKAHDDVGDYETAIGKFDAANALLRKLTFGDRKFDREAFRSSVDRQIEMFSAKTLSETGGDEVQLPLFVLGMIRSGTTLVDQILSCHPEVGSAGEQGFWIQNEKVVVDFRRLAINESEVSRLKSGYRDLLSSLAPGSRHVVDKNPANVLVAGLIHRVFPASRIICTQRNAVDTALSIWMTQMQTSAPFVFDRADIVFAYKEFLRVTNHWRNVMPESRYLEIRYESLVEDPESKSKEMIEFCGLNWDNACLKPESNCRTIRTPSFWQVRQPVYNTSVDRWKRYAKWLGPFEELAGL